LTTHELFYQPGGMLRAPWRLLAFVLIAVVAFAVIGWLAVSILPADFHATVEGVPAPKALALSSIVMLVALLVAHDVMLRWIDHLPWSYVGLGSRQAAPGLLGSGVLLGALAIGVPSLLLIALDWLEPHTAPVGSWVGFAIRVAAFLLPAALVEELLFRGYLFAVLRDAWGWKATLVVTSVLFGLLHGRNPGADAQSIIAVIIAGFFLGGVLVATGSLFAAWMAHFAWNWVMAALLHTAVSGLPFAGPDYRIIDAGPDWATGGRWGPEGGAGAIVGMLVALAYLYARWPRKPALPGTMTSNDVIPNDIVNQHHD